MTITTTSEGIELHIPEINHTFSKNCPECNALWKGTFFDNGVIYKCGSVYRYDLAYREQTNTITDPCRDRVYS